MAHPNNTDDVTWRGVCLHLVVFSILVTIYALVIIALLHKKDTNIIRGIANASIGHNSTVNQIPASEELG